MTAPVKNVGKQQVEVFWYISCLESSKFRVEPQLNTRKPSTHNPTTPPRFAFEPDDLLHQFVRPREARANPSPRNPKSICYLKTSNSPRRRDSNLCIAAPKTALKSRHSKTEKVLHEKHSPPPIFCGSICFCAQVKDAQKPQKQRTPRRLGLHRRRVIIRWCVCVQFSSQAVRLSRAEEKML